ncbi:hypothetical protein AKJ57_02475 [candidate division MSBL1 archaeon SCGC-AAA259A05]|uniref:Uncharacterized protein n=1 Tax=candidate division MSBL1 archaeon SCGC-AAA259A05 TaxID=1698259 RepID=A0A133UA98_9EURY|nr:hypothetical protein AKJ57_02475 [candidate division MSBL1 archaeon SCGC-AAA259A05]
MVQPSEGSRLKEKDTTPDVVLLLDRIVERKKQIIDLLPRINSWGSIPSPVPSGFGLPMKLSCHRQVFLQVLRYLQPT